MNKERLKLIALNFSRLRSERGWTQAHCAELGNVNTNYVSQVEAGHVKSFGAEAESKWAAIFGVDIAEFFKKPGNEIPVISRSAATSELLRAAAGLSESELRKVIQIVRVMAGKDHVADEEYLAITNHLKGASREVVEKVESFVKFLIDEALAAEQAKVVEEIKTGLKKAEGKASKNEKQEQDRAAS